MSQIKERPILFSAPMVNAILSGTKTQTRRLVKNIKDKGLGVELAPREIAGEINCKRRFELCPYGILGDQLWVRETHYLVYAQGNHNNRMIEIDYKADANYTKRMHPQKWRPSIHMPRFASRIQLEIVKIRVERLMDISEADAISEGISDSILGKGFTDYQYPNEMATRFATQSFMTLWDSINGLGSWIENPWVWVVDFKRVEE